MILSTVEHESLLALPDDQEELLRRYAFSESDLAIIRQRRGPSNRLGFAVLLCYLRYPGVVLGADEPPFPPLLRLVAEQLNSSVALWGGYGQREQTRRKHPVELQAAYGYRPFSASHARKAIPMLTALALQTDKGFVLARALVEELRQQSIILPSINTIERTCAEAITRANERIYATINEFLTVSHRHRLDALLTRKEEGKASWLAWLRQPPTKASSRKMLEHIERLNVLQALELPAGIAHSVHRNRLLKIAREGAQMMPADVARFEPQRRYATLAAMAREAMSTVTDEIIDMHDRIIGKVFNGAKNRHQQQFQASGKAINSKLRLYGCIGQALIEARKSGSDPFAAIESVIPWDTFSASVEEANKLAQSEDFDYLHRLGDQYFTLRRYAPKFLAVLKLHAAPAAASVLSAIELLRILNASGARKMPADVPKAFIRRRWTKLVFKGDGVDRRFYELCALSELRNALRAGDIWAEGSRQFKNFNAYPTPVETFTDMKEAETLPLPMAADGDRYLRERLSQLEARLDTVNRMALADDLPDAVITEAGLKITSQYATTPSAAQALINQAAAMLPRVKITELLLEVDAWTNFTRHFTHLKTGDLARHKHLLLTTILADAINLGLVKMAESCPGTTHNKLAWLHAWHIRDETYSSALAELVNAQFRRAFAKHWGEGCTSSSDGQCFKAGGKAESTGHINPKYSGDAGRLFYTHISDQYAPFHSTVINVGVRDATFVLDGLLYHESDLKIKEHYTDMAGFTDHVFALMHLLGFRFAPRIRDLGDTRLYVPKSAPAYAGLKPLIGGPLNTQHILAHWDDILRLAVSIKRGTATASLLLRKLGSYPRQNGLAIALRELGRIERTLFILDWLQHVELRRRVHAGLNKGEARNALARAVFFNRLGEVRDRRFEQQQYRTSGLNLVIAAIVLWNTVYLEQTAHVLRGHGHPVDDEMLRFLSPLGWEHINLTGDYVWPAKTKYAKNKFKLLRPVNMP